MNSSLSLLKAASHKYFRRIPLGRNPKTGTMRYRYIYKEHHAGGLSRGIDNTKEGEAFKLADPQTGQKGHFHVQKVSGDKITIKHDESGREVTISKAEFKALMRREHGAALKANAKKKRETYERMKRDRPKSISLSAAKRRAEAAEKDAGIEQTLKGFNKKQSAAIKKITSELVELQEGKSYSKSRRMEVTKTQSLIENYLGNQFLRDEGLTAKDQDSLKKLLDDFTLNTKINEEVKKQASELDLEPETLQAQIEKFVPSLMADILKIAHNAADTRQTAPTREVLERYTDNFETMPESKELSKKEKKLLSEITEKATESLSLLQRLITKHPKREEEHKSAMTNALRELFDIAVTTKEAREKGLLYPHKGYISPFLDKKNAQHKILLNEVKKIYENTKDFDEANKKAHLALLEPLINLTSSFRTATTVSAKDRREYTKINKRLRAHKEVLSTDNFDTMPEGEKKPKGKDVKKKDKISEVPNRPSRARQKDLLDELTDMLKAKPELYNDPRIVAIFGSRSDKTVNSERQNSEIMLTLDGKPKKGKVRYKIVEAGDAIPSHEPIGFNRRPDYPEGIQERKYHSDKAEMLKVMRNAKQFDPAYLINTNPDATNGAPVVTPEGIVLGGNSRVMSTQLVYANHPDKAEEYRKYLKLQADTFGFDSNEVDKFKSPLLVREYEPENKTKDHLAKLVRTLNETKTQGIDERQLGLATAVKIRGGQTLNVLKNMLNQSGAPNVEGLMTRPSSYLERFKEALTSDGVLNNENMNELIRQRDGTFNGRGRDFIKSMLVGYVVRDSDLLESFSTETINHLSTAISKLASAGINDHAREAMQDAIEIFHHAQSRDYLKRGMTPQKRNDAMNDIMINQRELFTAKEGDDKSEAERKQARFALTKDRVRNDPLASSFLKILTLSRGSRTLSDQMDKFVKLTEDTGVIDMFGGSTQRVSFKEAGEKLAADLAQEFNIEDQLYELNKSLNYYNLVKALYHVNFGR